jgi:hypothetical protein
MLRAVFAVSMISAVATQGYGQTVSAEESGQQAFVNTTTVEGLRITKGVVIGYPYAFVNAGHLINSSISNVELFPDSTKGTYSNFSFHFDRIVPANAPPKVPRLVGSILIMKELPWTKRLDGNYFSTMTFRARPPVVINTLRLCIENDHPSRTLINGRLVMSAAYIHNGATCRTLSGLQGVVSLTTIQTDNLSNVNILATELLPDPIYKELTLH